MLRPAPCDEANTTDNTCSHPCKEPEEHPFMQVEEFCCEPLAQPRPPELQEQTRPENLCTQETQEHRKNECVIVKDCKAAQDQARPKSTHGSDEERQHDECETSMEKKPRC